MYRTKFPAESVEFTEHCLPILASDSESSCQKNPKEHSLLRTLFLTGHRKTRYLIPHPKNAVMLLKPACAEQEASGNSIISQILAVSECSIRRVGF